MMKIKTYLEAIRSEFKDTLKTFERGDDNVTLPGKDEDDEYAGSLKKLSDRYTKLDDPTDDEIRAAQTGFETSTEEFDEDPEEEEDGEPNVRKRSPKNKPVLSDGYTEEDLDADMENLTYLVRQLFKNTEIEAEIEYDGLDIVMYVYLNRKEKLKSILKIFDLVARLKSDILPQYESAVELYESKERYPILQFQFEYDSEVPSNSLKPKPDEQMSLEFDGSDNSGTPDKKDSDENLPF